MNGYSVLSPSLSPSAPSPPWVHVVCVCVYMCTRVCVCAHACMHVHTCMHTCGHMYVEARG